MHSIQSRQDVFDGFYSTAFYRAVLYRHVIIIIIYMQLFADNLYAARLSMLNVVSCCRAFARERHRALKRRSISFRQRRQTSTVVTPRHFKLRYVLALPAAFERCT